MGHLFLFEWKINGRKEMKNEVFLYYKDEENGGRNFLLKR